MLRRRSAALIGSLTRSDLWTFDALLSVGGSDSRTFNAPVPRGTKLLDSESLLGRMVTLQVAQLTPG